MKQGLPAIRMPEPPLTGSCQCGKVRYRINAAPQLFYLCHCRECQRQSASAFGESLRVLASDLEIEGRMERVAWTADSGNRREGEFCPECGVRIVHGPLAAGAVNIKAGTLDDPTWLVPAGHVWTRSKHRFVDIGPEELSYETSPEDGMAALATRWREMLAQS